MININVKVTGLELSSEASVYLDKKISSLNKFVKDNDTGAEANIEVGKETSRHNKGDIFFTEINGTIGGKKIRARANGNSLSSSINKAKDVAVKLLRTEKDKKTNRK